MRFRAKVALQGKTVTGIQVPPEVVAALGSHQKPPVRVTIGDYTYRSTVATYAGAFLLPLSAQNRTAAGVAAGDVVDVDIELDDEAREVEVPSDLAAALNGIPGLRQAFDALAFTHRKEHVRAIEDAKTEQTRQRRIGRTVDAVTGADAVNGAEAVKEGGS